MKQPAHEIRTIPYRPRRPLMGGTRGPAGERTIIFEVVEKPDRTKKKGRPNNQPALS